ncbi:MAG: circularly permuted type 2 ATP-grasp protein, partial [Beijerinckiaceae bacterium]|nr:circularly permuted type 2 ATP-grasp protein [Beijerinckiaceae bacterium]
RLTGNAPGLAAQEKVTLSTTPVFENGSLVPRPMSMRIYLARHANGWTVMPGGLARIGKTSDPFAISLADGGMSGDVWVVSDNPVIEETMLPDGNSPHVRKQPAILPSRSAENLFWLGRYVERTECLMRLARTYHARLSEAHDPDAPLLKLLRALLASYDVDADKSLVSDLNTAIISAVSSASQVRYRFSRDGWVALSEIAETLRIANRLKMSAEDMEPLMSQLLQKVTGFSGLLHDNMYRFNGWRFLTIGRSLERAAGMIRTLIALGNDDAPEGAFDLALELGDSTMSYRRRYSITTSRDGVIDMLMLDDQNPRSVQYHLNEIRIQVAALPTRDLQAMEQQTMVTPLARTVLKLHTSLAVSLPEDIDVGFLNIVASEIGSLHDLLQSQYLR